MVEFTDADGVLQTFDLDNLGEHFYHADCMELLKALPDKCFDLAVVDPPYGIKHDGQKAYHGTISRRSRVEHPFRGWDTGIPPAEYFRSLERVSVNQIIWGGAITLWNI